MSNKLLLDLFSFALSFIYILVADQEGFSTCLLIGALFFFFFALVSIYIGLQNNFKKRKKVNDNVNYIFILFSTFPPSLSPLNYFPALRCESLFDPSLLKFETFIDTKISLSCHNGNLLSILNITVQFPLTFVEAFIIN